MTLFKTLYLDLASKIDNGEYQKGGVLPSEGELQKIYQVSRTTVRKAVDLLVADKKIIRRKGIGLFVAPSMSNQTIFDMAGIIKQTDINKEYKIFIRDIFLRKANPFFADVFDINDDELLYAVSFMNQSKTSTLLEKLWLPLDYFPDFDINTLKVTPILEVVNSGKLDVQDLYQDFQLIESSEEEAKLLDIAIGSPLFKITNMFSDSDKQIIAIEVKIQDALKVKYTIDFN
jgi:DNA-binding GntR family transcriptional regulator